MCFDADHYITLSEQTKKHSLQNKFFAFFTITFYGNLFNHPDKTAAKGFSSLRKLLIIKRLRKTPKRIPKEYTVK